MKKAEFGPGKSIVRLDLTITTEVTVLLVGLDSGIITRKNNTKNYIYKFKIYKLASQLGPFIVSDVN